MTSYNNVTQTEMPCVNQPFKKEMGFVYIKRERKERGVRKKQKRERKERKIDGVIQDEV